MKYQLKYYKKTSKDGIYEQKLYFLFDISTDREKTVLAGKSIFL